MENDGTTTDPAVAAAQLAALQAGREQVARQARQPWWYDPALGLCLFVLFAGLAMDTIVGTVVGIVVFAVGVRLLMSAYRRATGFWIGGLRAGRTRRAVTVWFVVYAVVVVPALVLAYGFGHHWVLLPAGGVLAIAIALVSRWWTTIYIAELTERP